MTITLEELREMVVGLFTENGTDFVAAQDFKDLIDQVIDINPGFSLTGFGAVGDGVADDTLPLKSAIAAVNAAGRGTIYIPPGVYRIIDPITPPTVPCAIRGAGMGVSVIDWDNVDHLFTNSAVTPRHTYQYLTFEDLTIDGRWDFYQNDVPASAPVLIYGYDFISFRRVEIRNCTWFGLTLRNCEFVSVENCVVYEVGRDGLSLDTNSYVQVVDNRIDHCGDDAIAVHIEQGNAGSVRQGVVIVGNRISDAHGIKALGLRRGTISGNTLERIKGNGIVVGAVPTARGTSHAISIADNTITDVIDRTTIDAYVAGAKYIQVLSEAQAGTGVAVPGLPNGSGTFEPLNAALDNNASGDPYAPALWVSITGNTLARTLPTGVTYSSLGHGQFFTDAGYLNPTLTAAMLSTTSIGIELAGGLRDTVVADNTINGMDQGVAIYGATTDWENVSIHDNTISRFITGGIVFSGTITGGKNISIKDNTFDGDPQHEHSNRGANGTWLASGAPWGVIIQSGSGVTVRGNVFRRVAVISDLLTDAGGNNVLFQDNIWDCDPAAVGFSTSNKGIGNVPRGSGKGVVRVVDNDPVSATYGTTLNVCQTDSNAKPTSGKYVQGHFVRNNTPAIGDPLGWLRLSTGSAHTLLTDWKAVDDAPFYGDTTAPATAPSFSWAGRTGDGMYSQATGSIAWSALGREELRIDGPGNATGTTQLHVGSQKSTGTVGIELGQARSGDGRAYLDLHASVGLNYGGRVAREPGVNGTLDIDQTGTGSLRIITEAAAAISFLTNSTPRWNIQSDGLLVPQADNIYDIGTTAAKVRDGHFASSVNVGATGGAVGGFRLGNNQFLFGQTTSIVNVPLATIGADNVARFGSTATGVSETQIQGFGSTKVLYGTAPTMTHHFAPGFTYIANSTGIATGAPVGGGYLYVQSGALRFRGSSGTDVQVAAP